MGVGVAMAVVEYTAASLPSTRMGLLSTTWDARRWASVPMRGVSGKGRQCETPGLQRRSLVVARAAEDGAAGGGGGNDRAAVLEESKKLLAMQKELLDQVRNWGTMGCNHARQW